MSPTLVVDGNPKSIGYFKFDLSPYAGRTVTSAKLQLRVTTGSTRKQYAKQVSTDTWSETGLTFWNRPGLGTSVGTLGPTTANTDPTVPLTVATVQGELGQTMSLGLDTGAWNAVQLASRETTTPPTLVLVLQ